MNIIPVLILALFTATADAQAVVPKSVQPLAPSTAKPIDPLIGKLVRAYNTPEVMAPLPDLTPRHALELQFSLVSELSRTRGDLVGFKAALTSATAQQQFGVQQPLLGFFLEHMLIPAGSTVDHKTGVRLLVEADLLVRVKDRSINSARTREQVLAALDVAVPFIEIPDMMLHHQQRPGAAALTAINTGARYGVMGVHVDLTTLSQARLADFTVTLTDNRQQTLGIGRGTDLLGHPLNSVLWIVAQAHKLGLEIEPGHWLSLGSLTAPAPAQPDHIYTATYTGLTDQPLSIKVRIR